ncbi:hypothetical protein [Aquimarina sp. I32.4]|uniref:hypothetical protein n=1 Tax=Aquimarina sp. I32.4 TaxID=2053903 RepID=UPI000CDF2330|nr:hypothetical protein [Aquimarina sp. I32.4]
MRKSNETLRGVDDILRPAIERAVKPRFDGKPPTAFDIGWALRWEIDNTRTALSEALYKVDLATDEIGVRRSHMHQWQSLQPYAADKVNTQDYVRRANNGYQVWDGYKWTQLSKDAKISVTSERSEATHNKLGVVVRAEDIATNTHILFVDNDVYKRGGEITYNGPIGGDPDLGTRFISQEINWEDPMYDAVKMGTAITGKAAGALAMNRIGNLTPWHKGENLYKARGWYRNQEGKLRKLSSQRNTVGAGGHRVGARTASNNIKYLKNGAKICMWISIGISLYEAGSAGFYKDSNRNEVYTKASIDIVMALVGTRGAIGWVISGSYFILSATGTFGDWGQPSGVTSNGVPYDNSFGQLGTFGSTYSDDFDIDYVPSIQHKRSRMRERLYHMQDRDHTYVKPQVHYRVNMDGQEFYPIQDFYNRL